MGFGGSYECASSTLLCQEDNTSILGFDVVVQDDGDVGSRDDEYMGDNDGFHFMDFPLQSDQSLALLVSQESHHLPRDDYSRRLLTGSLDISVRREAIDWIGKVHAHYKFGPLSAYLSINYLDRFLSCYDLSQGKAWMAQLLSVVCLSLAAKMEENEVPLSLDLQVGEAKYVFEAKTIQRMELLVLTTLQWRMRAVTPFSFMDYFLHKFNNGKSSPRSSLSRCVDLILNTIRRIDFLEFKPSEVAMAVALSITGETRTSVDARKSISSCIHIDRERALKCYEIIKNMAMIRRPFKSSSGWISSVPQSPIGVLDNASQSYKSDDTAVGSLPNSEYSSPDAKRRRLNY